MPGELGGKSTRNRPLTAETCPDKARHSASPDGYLAWHEWAEKKAKTHRQIRCPTCNLFAIWVPK